MNAQISTEIKQKGDGSDFIKTAPSTYALNPDKKEVPKPDIKVKNVEDKQKTKDELNGSFIGRPGSQ